MWIYFLFAIREREYADSTGHGVEQKKDREPPQSLGSQIYQSKGILQWSSCLTQQQTSDLEPGHPQ